MAALASSSTIWRLHPEATLIWASFEDGHVVYNSGTGMTHRLDDQARAILAALEGPGADLDTLIDSLAGDATAKERDAARAPLAATLAEFARLGLVEQG
jgi:PqqD family protein of HPr-rel-A system